MMMMITKVTKIKTMITKMMKMRILPVSRDDLFLWQAPMLSATGAVSHVQFSPWVGFKSELLDPKQEKSPTCCNFENFDHDPQLEMKF